MTAPPSLAIDFPAGWLQQNRWTAALTASAYLLARGEPEVSICAGLWVAGRRLPATAENLARLRDLAAQDLADDLAPWLASGLPVALWPSAPALGDWPGFTPAGGLRLDPEGAP